MAKPKKPLTPIQRARKAEKAALAAVRKEAAIKARAELKRMNQKPRCVECQSWDVRMTTGAEVYPNHPNLAKKQIWICVCGAYVGCHEGTDYKPLGRPGGPLTRRARGEAHAAFDPLWLKVAERDNLPKGRARNRGYRFLAEQLGIERADCHISHMDAAMCRRVVEICAAVRRGEIKRPDPEPEEPAAPPS